MAGAGGPKKTFIGSYTLEDVIGFVLVGGFTGWLCVLAFVVFLLGAPYFWLDEAGRQAHKMHSWYRPGGLVGLLTGFLGTGLMVAMLAYSVRKWLTFVPMLGSPVWWLRFHIVCGIMGPAFILLHGGFKLPGGMVSIAFWCMILVALSGVFGRYLFGHFPTTANGRRLDLQFMQKSLSELRAQLVSQTQDVREQHVADAVSLARELKQEPRTLLGLMMLDLEVRHRSDMVRILLYRAGIPIHIRKEAANTLVAQLKMKRSLAGWEVARRFFRYWHLFHQPLAVAMYMITALHIFNAIIFGGVLTTLLGG